MQWDSIVQKVAPYVVKIETPTGHGTGYLCAYSKGKSFCAVATALHVVADADDWQQPMRIHTSDFKRTTFLKEDRRVVLPEPNTDSAVVLFEPSELDLPESLIPLRPMDAPLSIGTAVGWLGFPAIEARTLCFFAGSVSARREDRSAYLVDGVAIHGVSGGPMLYASETDGAQFVGVVSAYRPNRQGSQTLPGLLMAHDVSHFHTVIRQLKTWEEAREKRAEMQARATDPGADVPEGASQESPPEPAPPPG